VAHTIVSHHCTDEYTGGGQARRRIQNWQNYRTPAGLWLPAAAPVFAAKPDAPQDATHTIDASALCVAVGDKATESRDNRCQLVVAPSDLPDVWLSMTPLGVSDGAKADPECAGATASWPDVWRDCTLEFVSKRGSAGKRIITSGEGGPEFFEFVLTPAAGCVIRPAEDGTIALLGPKGEEILRTRPAWGRGLDDDVPIAVTSEVRPYKDDGSSSASVKAREGSFIVRLTPSREDMQRARFRAEIDPTVTISGTSAIEDAMIHGVNTTYNYGSQNTFSVDSITPTRSLLRIATSSLPPGVHDAFRLFMYHGTNGRTTRAYFVADANADWVEGTVQTQAQTGSCCWAYKAYHASTPTNWAGSAGLGTSGTDYDADASPPSCATTSANAYLQLTLRGSWSQSWKNGSRANGGIRLVCASGADGIQSTEASSNQPYAEIDYTARAPLVVLGAVG
jgi:hypothetical protein